MPLLPRHPYTPIASNSSGPLPTTANPRFEKPLDPAPPPTLLSAITTQNRRLSQSSISSWLSLPHCCSAAYKPPRLYLCPQAASSFLYSRPNSPIRQTSPKSAQTDKVQFYVPAMMKYSGYFLALVPDEVREHVAQAHPQKAQKTWAKSSFRQRRQFLRILLKYIIEHQELICEWGLYLYCLNYSLMLELEWMCYRSYCEKN